MKAIDMANSYEAVHQQASEMDVTVNKVDVVKKHTTIVQNHVIKSMTNASLAQTKVPVGDVVRKEILHEMKDVLQKVRNANSVKR